MLLKKTLLLATLLLLVLIPAYGQSNSCEDHSLLSLDTPSMISDAIVPAGTSEVQQLGYVASYPVSAPAHELAPPRPEYIPLPFPPGWSGTFLSQLNQPQMDVSNLQSFPQNSNSQVEIFSDFSLFMSTTQASLVPFGDNDFTCYTLTLPGFTITAPNGVVRYLSGLGWGILVYWKPNLVVHAEDDFLFDFSTPVNAIGLRLNTNHIAQERVVIKDENGNTLYSGSIGNYTLPRSHPFVGFRSSVPIRSFYLDTDGGSYL